LGHAQVVETLAQADVAVVEAYDPEAPGHQTIDETRAPGHQLHAQAHDEQQGLPIDRTVVFHLQADAVGRDLHACVFLIQRRQA